MHGLRPLPAAIYPENAPSKYTIKTWKHMEARHIVRQNHEEVGVGGDPTAKEKLKIPDIDQEDETKAPFYRSEPRAAFLMLPNLRPACLTCGANYQKNFS
jgi:hypothetical protein